MSRLQNAQHIVIEIRHIERDEPRTRVLNDYCCKLTARDRPLDATISVLIPAARPFATMPASSTFDIII
jgi:hypothetical protein